ncbi:replication protein A subunit RPA32 [Dacryopinax primogenitus]|uniref:Replication protein A subunit RPA32 n=1 Tax=Dacryopinax primogenitus (strain DJM 731) TaxID=1858805 RepID=M5G9M6_DACPD|nr:replication protein A subunit RPA32 [Dacryopinax primogenitus]EJU04975.1 replication protein A subunit RPA32 [Dacryopinax primogenitus]
MSSPYYGNAGGGGGGGFSRSPYGSQESPSGNTRKAGTHSLRPVTVRQVVQSDHAFGDAEWQIDGSDAPSVTFVAQVRGKAQQATNTAFSLEDGTGQIDARLWSDSQDPDTAAGSEIENDVWVRVQGTIKEFNKKKHVAAQRVRPITDMQEVYYHYCEALSVHLELTRGQVKGGGGALTSGAANVHAQVNGPTNVSSDYTMGGGGGGTANNYAHMPALDRAIMQFIESSANSDGCHLTAISRAVARPGVTAEQISLALERLSDDGHVYNTHDDNHFQSVNMS